MTNYERLVSLNQRTSNGTDSDSLRDFLLRWAAPCVHPGYWNFVYVQTDVLAIFFGISLEDLGSFLRTQYPNLDLPNSGRWGFPKQR